MNNTLIHAVLNDWHHLATTAHDYPVQVHTLVTWPPDIIAASNTSKQGMGGFWLASSISQNSLQAILWHVPVSYNIKQRLVTQKTHIVPYCGPHNRSD
jgi:hypothetical protein